MESTLWCQSCGMPLTQPEMFGTNADGTANQEYCVYCRKDGAFTQNVTMDEMIELNLAYLDEFNRDSPVKYTKDEARGQMKEFFPHLKRWKK